MGIYGDPKLLKWFTTEYAKHAKTKVDMGKSCLRFKKMDQIPYALIGELASKMTPQDWIDQYTAVLQSRPGKTTKKTTPARTSRSDGDDGPRTIRTKGEKKTTDDRPRTTKKKAKAKV